MINKVAYLKLRGEGHVIYLYITFDKRFFEGGGGRRGRGKEIRNRGVRGDFDRSVPLNIDGHVESTCNSQSGTYDAMLSERANRIRGRDPCVNVSRRNEERNAAECLLSAARDAVDVDQKRRRTARRVPRRVWYGGRRDHSRDTWSRHQSLFAKRSGRNSSMNRRNNIEVRANNHRRSHPRVKLAAGPIAGDYPYFPSADVSRVIGNAPEG